MTEVCGVIAITIAIVHRHTDRRNLNLYLKLWSDFIVLQNEQNENIEEKKL